jgi:transcriptional regulator with XRE-family HTH domain
MSITLPPWRSLREAAGLSLREVARRTGINPGRLSTIERGLIPTEDERDGLRRVLADANLGEENNGTQGTTGPDDTAA